VLSRSMLIKEVLQETSLSQSAVNMKLRYQGT
jgi:hypothetical protein